MSAPLSSSDQNKIQSVETAITKCIKSSQSGKVNFSDISDLQKQLAQLANNPNIPDGVRQNLQAALNELKQIKSGSTATLSSLTSAKVQLDQALGGKEEGGKTEGGSLGGGSEE